MKKITAITLICSLLCLNLLGAVTNYTQVVPLPSETVNKWVKEDKGNRELLTTVFQYTGGILFVAGFVVKSQTGQDIGLPLKVAGGIIYLCSFITNIKGEVETQGGEIVDLPNKTTDQQIKKEALAADFIFDQAEKDGMKKIEDTATNVAENNEVSVFDVFNVIKETRSEKAARKIKAQVKK